MSKGESYYRIKIREWYTRLQKELNNAPAYIFKDTIEVMKEMGREIEATDY